MTGLTPRATAQDTVPRTGAFRKLIEVPADEVIPGDQMRDHGVMRQVTGTGASVVELSVVVFFDETDGFDNRLCVPLFQTVSVWRVCCDR
jgi:hypothetical protein